MSLETTTTRNLRQTRIKFKNSDMDLESNSDDAGSDDEYEGDKKMSFLCEFCDSEVQIFSLKEGLVAHCLKYHPNACVGCFEMCASSEDLQEHLETFPHEPPVCRACCRSFASAVTMKRHRCPNAVRSNSSAPDKIVEVKIEPQIIESMDGSEAGTYFENTDGGIKDHEKGRPKKKLDSSLKFVCEFCKRSKTLKSKVGLVNHSLKYHPNACVGCFEMCASSEDLQEHLETFPHEPPVCRACCRSFASVGALKNHTCWSMNYSLNSKTKQVKVENSDSDTSDQSACSDEKNFEEESVTEEDESVDAESSQRARKAKRDLNCVNCSFVAEGVAGYLVLQTLRNHTCVAHPHACGICFENFDDNDSLTAHRKSMGHHFWVCAPCGKMFTRKKSHSYHFGRNHVDQCPFRCPKCDQVGGFTKSSIYSHIKKYHPDESQVELTQNRETGISFCICAICNYRAGTSLGLIMHMYQQHPDTKRIPMFKCDCCEISFARSSSLCYHIKRKHWKDPEFRDFHEDYVKNNPLELACEPCEKSFNIPYQFLLHLKAVHPSSLPHTCSMCSSGFLNPFDLRVHECRNHTRLSPFTCDYCNSTFKDLDGLTMHLFRLHKMKTLPFAYCFIHDLSFVNKTQYEKHVMWHEKTHKRFECKECGKVLLKGNNKSIERHLKMHQSERPFVCETCGKGFATAELLKGHAKMHSTKNQCDTCGKTFHSATLLQRHAVVHTGERPFQCSICGLRVSQNSSLRRHLAKVHPGGIVGEPRTTKARKSRNLSKVQQDKEEPSGPAVRLNTKLLQADLKKKPSAILPTILPKSSRERKRRRPSSSEESESEEEDEEEAPPAAKTTVPRKAKTEGRKRLRLHQTTESDAEEDEDDERYTP